MGARSCRFVPLLGHGLARSLGDRVWGCRVGRQRRQLSDLGPLRTRRGLPRGNWHQGKQRLQLLWPERRDPEGADGAGAVGDPWAVRLEVLIIARLADCSGSPQPRRKVRGGLGLWPMLWDRISLAWPPALPFC